MRFKFPHHSATESEATVKRDRLVAFLATLFQTLLILFYTPAVLFSKNRFFLEGAFLEYVARSSGVLAIVLTAAFLAFFRLPRRIARSVASVFSFAAISSFVMSAFITPLTVDIGLVDGSRQAIAINYFLATLEIGILLALLGTFWWLYDRIASVTRDLLVLLCILLVAYTGYVAVKDFVESRPTVSSAGEFMRFSEDDNILLVLLDTLASDFVLALLDEKPILAQQLDGFTLFRDTASVAPTTYMAMPSIHSGQFVSPDQSFRKAYEELIGQQSFLTAAARKGAEVYLLNKIFLCPDQVTCVTSADLVSGGHAAVMRDWYLLVDIALFRVLPHATKPLIYNDGDWFLSSTRKTDDSLSVLSYRDNRAMEEIARRLRVEGKQSQVKFVHLRNTHYPYNVGRECEVVAVDNHSLDLALNAARCAIERLVAILDALKRNGIYDSTLIVVFSDHGSHLGYSGRVATDRIEVDETLRFQLHEAPEDRSRSASRVPRKAHAAFLVKRPGDRGRVKLDTEHAVSLTDLPATVCAYSELCTTERGIDAFEAPEASSRERLFNDYVWQPEMWGADDLEEDLKRMVIDYPVLERIAYDTVGDTFFFNQESYRFMGFGHAEGWGRWSIRHESELKLCFAVPPKSPLELVFDCRVAVNDQVPRQRALVRMDGEIVKEQAFGSSQAGGTGCELRVGLQPRQVDESGCVDIEFAFPDAFLPAAGGPNETRLLALGLKSLRFE